MWQSQNDMAASNNNNNPKFGQLPTGDTWANTNRATDGVIANRITNGVIAKRITNWIIAKRATTRDCPYG